MFDQCFTDRDFNAAVLADDPVIIESDLRSEAWLTVNPLQAHEDTISLHLWDEARGNTDICRWLGDGFESPWVEDIPQSQMEGMAEHFDHGSPEDMAQHATRVDKHGSMAWMDPEAKLAWATSEDDGPRVQARGVAGAASEAIEVNEHARLELLADLLLLADGTDQGAHAAKVAEHLEMHELAEAIHASQHTGEVQVRFGDPERIREHLAFLRARREASPTSPRIPQEPKPRTTPLRVVDEGRSAKVIVELGQLTKDRMSHMVEWAKRETRTEAQLTALRSMYQVEGGNLTRLRQEWKLATARKPAVLCAMAKPVVQLTDRDRAEAAKAAKGPRAIMLTTREQLSTHIIGWPTASESFGSILTTDRVQHLIGQLSLTELRSLYREIAGLFANTAGQDRRRDELLRLIIAESANHKSLVEQITDALDVLDRIWDLDDSEDRVDWQADMREYAAA